MRGILGRVIDVREFAVAANVNSQWPKERISIEPWVRLTFRVRQARSLTSPNGKVNMKAKGRPAENGIQAFFSKADGAVKQKPDGVSKFFVTPKRPETPSLDTVANPIVPKKPKKPVLKAPETPSFHPVRAACTDLEFADCLKIREFVLTCISQTQD